MCVCVRVCVCACVRAYVLASVCVFSCCCSIAVSIIHLFCFQVFIVRAGVIKLDPLLNEGSVLNLALKQMVITTPLPRLAPPQRFTGFPIPRFTPFPWPPRPWPWCPGCPEPFWLDRIKEIKPIDPLAGGMLAARVGQAIRQG